MSKVINAVRGGPRGRLKYRVTFEMSAERADAQWYGPPTPKWIAKMVATPGSVWTLEDVKVECMEPAREARTA